MGDFLKRFFKRVGGLLLKLAGFEGLIFLIATKAMFMKIMTPETWVGAAAICAGIKTYQAYKGLAQDIKINNQNAADGLKADADRKAAENFKNKNQGDNDADIRRP
jgi:hypothetical protein